jgi:hypothetical protein
VPNVVLTSSFDSVIFKILRKSSEVLSPLHQFNVNHFINSATKLQIRLKLKKVL